MKIILFFLYLSLSSSNVMQVFCTGTSKAKENPFAAKASLIRYWNKHISNNLPKPPFLISKASPLNAIDLAKLTKLANSNSLPSHIESFCSLANLFCLFEDSSKPDVVGKRNQDASFAVYSSKSFSDYGTSRLGGVDSFKNYSDGLNTPNESFKKYNSESNGHREEFSSYAKDANVASDNFTNYGSSATGGSGEFNNYQERVNVPNLQFTSYDSDGNNHKLSFSSYSPETNSGSEAFISYGKNGNAVPVEFTSYSDNANIIGSSFTGYGELGSAPNDSFKAYGDSGNNPHNNFKSYSLAANSGINSFTSYRDSANVGDDSFQSYARNSNSGKVNFANYGKTFNVGNDTFKEYGKGSTGSTTIGFKIYGLDRSFKDYAKKGVTFAGYSNSSSKETASSLISGISVNIWVEPGKFFRESILKQGNVMVMPDIEDKMPERSFLPRRILSKLPFSTSHISEIREIFGAPINSTMERVLVNALTECERPASRGETKRCVGSVEDMIDFATLVLGHNVTVRTTLNVKGSKQEIRIGEVKGINGGKVTKLVSCHQSLYPYLLYYCHSVPKVRAYEAEILEVESQSKINHGVAVCHLDTSAWSPSHGAFVALGSSPGRIEVCHWIFENDMTWTIVD
ncbi:polygalacturonase 1 beta-like protein 3 [Durio zibethinus]|uniref:Polygalacturonase 1 beta-like protein 3 n=1 Tax=Durio zibethinus TaxID=66656 RepID=A0A6P5YDC3_DURZI|nr:polygalacturonase 1 beta-like protein 3 [Durio zibethinus]